MACYATSRLFFLSNDRVCLGDACQCLVKHAACSYSTLHLYLHSLCERRLRWSLSLALLVCLIAVIPTHVRTGRPLSYTLSPELSAKQLCDLFRHNLQGTYSRTLPVVEAVEDAERHAAMLFAASPANADLEHHVELLQAGEGQTLSIFPFSF